MDKGTRNSGDPSSEDWRTPGPQTDAELQQAFRNTVTPQHGARFWDDLSSAMKDETLIDVNDKNRAADRQSNQSELRDTRESAEDRTLRPQPSRFDSGRRRRLAGRLGIGGVAAASIVALSMVVIGDPTPTSNSVDETAAETDLDSGIQDFSTYEVRSVGTGSIAAVAHNGQEVFVVDDAPGDLAGCGDDQLVTLFVQQPDGSGRSQILPSDIQIKAERVEVRIGANQPDGSYDFAWTDYCRGPRRATYTASFDPGSDDGLASNVVRLDDAVVGTAEDPLADIEVTASLVGSLAVSDDGQHGLEHRDGLSVVAASDESPCATQQIGLDAEVTPTVATWAPNNRTVAFDQGNDIVIWDCLTQRDVTIVDVTPTPDHPILFDPTGRLLFFTSTDQQGNPVAQVVDFS